MKIVIIGYSGSGKSTLAKELSLKHNLPLLHLDTITHSPGWIKKSLVEIDNSLFTFLEENSSWVIDGNYSAHYFERRCEEADKIIFLNFNRFVCFFSAFKRYLKYRGKSRESAPEGCKETLNFKFIKWLLFEGRTKERKKKFNNIVELYNDKIIIFKNRRQVNRYILNN